MTAPNQGFDELFDRLFPVIARTVVHIVDDRAEAEDVTAEAFARALARWRKIGRLDWREAWITRVVFQYPFRLRSGQTAYLHLPPQLDRSDVDRLIQLLESLVMQSRPMGSPRPADAARRDRS